MKNGSSYPTCLEDNSSVKSNSGKRKRHMKNRQRLGGNGLSLEAFVNAKSSSSYNPHLIKKQQELYKNAKLIKKYKKTVKQQNSSGNHVPSLSIPEEAKEGVDSKNTERRFKRRNNKSSLQSARQDYQKMREEEEKMRAEKEAVIKAREEGRARAEGRRKALRERMFKRTRSGQPVMKYRIEHLLQGIQNS